MSIPDEKRLLRRLASSDPEAFVALYRHYAPSIRRFTEKIVKSPDLSFDLTQDVFVRIWDHREQLGEIKAFKSYLQTASKNTALNFLKRAAIDRHAKGLIARQLAEHRPDTFQEVVTADYAAYLQRLLAEIPPQSREVFRLCRQEYKTYDEAAALLGISRNTVKKHMVRTLKYLSESVERDLGITLGLLMAVVFPS